MPIEKVSVRTADEPVEKSQAHFAALCVTEAQAGKLGDLALDKALGGLVAQMAREESFKGGPEDQLLVHTHGTIGPLRVLLLGVGDDKEFSLPDLRHHAARAYRAARKAGAKSLHFEVPAVGGGDARPRALEAAALGARLGRYRFDRYLSEERRKPDAIEEVRIGVAGGWAGADGAAIERALGRAAAIADATAGARDLVNEPPVEVTPARMAETARALAAGAGLSCQVLDREECRKRGMALYLAVAAGSAEEPRFIHLTYKPKAPPRRRVALVGKGITFDSGGLSLKPSNAMEDMKMDMAGGAAALHAVAALARLECPYEVHAIVAATENMPGGRAYKLGDVYRGMGGKSVEINNTDAEGRLTLADALAYAVSLGPAEIVDLATLTGACMVALGPHISGAMGNDDALMERVLAAGKASGEELWRLPLPDRLKDQLKSEVADMKNTGERFGGALTAGLFLREFVGKTPWVHLDIAGPAFAGKAFGACDKGGTGFGVAALVHLYT